MQHGQDNTIPVIEVFGPTIQGEGPNTGLKVIFVRVAGCDFKCAWCDSKFAWNKKDATQYQPKQLSDDLIDLCKKTNTDTVILTGGNPCLYDFLEVIDNLHNELIKVNVETQGSILPDWLKYIDLLVISPKAPSSKMKDVSDEIHRFLVSENYSCDVAIKIPIFNDLDLKFAEEYYKFCQGLKRCDINIKFYLTVGNTNTTEENSISERILKDYEKLIEKVMNSSMKDVYILPQVHTLVWGNKQGV